MNKPIFSIIIASWNVKDLLDKCLDSIYSTKQNIDFEVVVIDNASQDKSAEMVKKNFSQVKLITNSENKGFSYACHQGAEASEGEYLLFLNDDTEITDHTLEKTFEYFKNNSEIGVLGCHIVNQDGSMQRSVRKFPNFFDQLIILSKLHNFFPKFLNSYLLLDFDYHKTQAVDQVMGAFFLTTRKIWNELGGFDKNFYIWFEEVDYCLRVAHTGYKTIYLADVQVKHHLGASFKQLSALKEQKIFNNSLLLYAKKHFSIWQYYLLVCFMPISLLFAFLVVGLDKLHINPKK